MIGRRTFLITCGSAVAAPVFAQLAMPAAARAEAQGVASEMPAASAAAIRPAQMVLRIDGWESPAGSESDVWVHINSSWRAAWR